MAFKTFELEEIGPVTVYKRRGTRNVRLTVAHDGAIRISIPAWLPYQAGLSYAQTKKRWLLDQIVRHQPAHYTNGQMIGKAHTLYLQAGEVTAVRTRVTNDSVIVTHPTTLHPTDADVQVAATKACIRALRQEAEAHLPARLRDLAALHDFSYSSVRIKQLKSRWGSCDQDQHITLNLYLMQLPWNLIDYVLLHELVHTKIMQHGPKFWGFMEELAPDTRQLRKEIKAYKTAILR